MKVNDHLRAVVAVRKAAQAAESKLISELTVKEFKELMRGCLKSYDYDKEILRQRAGLSNGYEMRRLIDAE